MERLTGLIAEPITVRNVETARVHFVSSLERSDENPLRVDMLAETARLALTLSRFALEETIECELAGKPYPTREQRQHAYRDPLALIDLATKKARDIELVIGIDPNPLFDTEDNLIVRSLAEVLYRNRASGVNTHARKAITAIQDREEATKQRVITEDGLVQLGPKIEAFNARRRARKLSRVIELTETPSDKNRRKALKTAKRVL